MVLSGEFLDLSSFQRLATKDYNLQGLSQMLLWLAVKFQQKHKNSKQARQSRHIQDYVKVSEINLNGLRVGVFVNNSTHSPKNSCAFVRLP